MPEQQTSQAPAPAAREPIKNCAGCGKPMKKAKRYYRNGHYYCNKNCFKAVAAKAAAPAEAKAA